MRVPPLRVTPTSRSDLDFGGAPFMKRQIESLRKGREKTHLKRDLEYTYPKGQKELMLKNSNASSTSRLTLVY